MPLYADWLPLPLPLLPAPVMCSFLSSILIGTCPTAQRMRLAGTLLAEPDYGSRYSAGTALETLFRHYVS